MATARSTSSGVAPSGSVTRPASGTATSLASLSVNSTTALTVPAESVSMPSRRDWSTIVATSSSVNVEAASSFGSTRNSRTTPLAVAFSPRITG